MAQAIVSSTLTTLPRLLGTRVLLGVVSLRRLCIQLSPLYEGLQKVKRTFATYCVACFDAAPCASCQFIPGSNLVCEHALALCIVQGVDFDCPLTPGCRS
jgi:hypothetical protein